jgi:hypothetical protein
MPIALLLVGAILIVIAVRGEPAELGAALQEDIPGYFKWAIAIALILALGYAPGMQKPSRWLLGLVALVILVKNYQQIFGGLTDFAASGGSIVPGTGTTATASTSGSSPGSDFASAMLNPQTYLGLFTGGLA